MTAKRDFLSAPEVMLLRLLRVAALLVESDEQAATDAEPSADEGAMNGREQPPKTRD